MLRQTGLLLTLFFLTASAPSQERPPLKVRVGDSTVNGSILRPYTNLWQMSVITPSGKENLDVGTWSDQVEFVKISGHDFLQRTQVATFKKKGQVLATTKTVNVFDPKTLAPVSRSFSKHLQQGGDDSTHLTFEALSIHMEQTKDGKTITQDTRLEAPVFDFYGGLYGLLLATFPLKSGFSASFASVGEDQPTVSQVTFTVTGEETVDAGPKGKVDAWVVTSDTSQGPMKFWLTQTAPFIIRLEYKAKDSGVTWIYKMI